MLVAPNVIPSFGATVYVRRRGAMPDFRKESEEQIRKKGGDMTTQEAGHLGGHKGGQRVKELIEEGKEKEVEDKKKP